jgi:hypothetical protein
MGVEYQQQQQGQTSIFEGLDEYVPSRKKEDERKKKEEESGQHSGSYFARSAGKGRWAYLLENPSIQRSNIEKKSDLWRTGKGPAKRSKGWTGKGNRKRRRRRSK